MRLCPKQITFLTGKCVPAVTLHPQGRFSTFLIHRRGGWAGSVWITGCVSQMENSSPVGLERAQSCSWVGTYKRWGGQAQMCHTLVWLPQKSCPSTEKDLFFLLQPLLEALPRRLYSRTDTQDFCRLCQTRFTKSFPFPMTLSIYITAIARKICMNLVAGFTPLWLSFIPVHPLRKEGTQWHTSIENETVPPQRN